MDSAQYPRVFRKFWIQIHNYASNLLLDRDAAQDVAQDAFIALYNNLGKIKDDNHCKAFLHICARNQCYNVIGGLKRHRVVMVPESIQEMFSCEIADFDVIESEVMAFLYEKIEVMPTRRKDIFLLFLSGLTWKQVAKKLNCPPKTAINQRKFAVDFLQAQFKLKYG